MTEAELQRIEGELDRGYNPDWGDTLALVHTVRTLRDAVATYAGHAPTCLALEIAPGACDCGFASVWRGMFGDDNGAPTRAGARGR